MTITKSTFADDLPQCDQHIINESRNYGRNKMIIEPTVVWAQQGDPDPEEHDYVGDGTSRCPVCMFPMNAHITFEEKQS